MSVKTNSREGKNWVSNTGGRKTPQGEQSEE